MSHEEDSPIKTNKKKNSKANIIVKNKIDVEKLEKS